MARKKSHTTAPHPLAAAIRAESEKEAPAEPVPQSIPAAVWSALRGLRNRGYSVEQIAIFLGRHGYTVDPNALAVRLKPRAPRQVQPQSITETEQKEPKAAAASTVAPAVLPQSGKFAPSERPPDQSPMTSTLTPKQRDQYKIPDWADCSDIRHGETPEKYARRKRLEGPPRDATYLKRFIGKT